MELLKQLTLSSVSTPKFSDNGMCGEYYLSFCRCRAGITVWPFPATCWVTLGRKFPEFIVSYFRQSSPLACNHKDLAHQLCGLHCLQSYISAGFYNIKVIT